MTDTQEIKRHEVVVDEAIASAYGVVLGAQRTVDTWVKDIRSMAPNGAQRNYLNVEEVRTKMVSGEWVPRYRQDFVRYFTRYDESLAELRDAQRLYEIECRNYEGWSRFFFVPGGHIHSSMNCSSCNNGIYATQFGWLPELSGLSEIDAVESQGAILCTICFPSAPVEWTNQYELDEIAKLADRCEGSGKYVESNRGRRYAKCPVCNSTEVRTSTGKIRAHKRIEKRGA